MSFSSSVLMTEDSMRQHDNPEIVFSFQDSQDPNPLIRALAVRTMGCIRVDKITEYLCDPLQRCLKVHGNCMLPMMHRRMQQCEVDNFVCMASDNRIVLQVIGGANSQ